MSKIDTFIEKIVNGINKMKVPADVISPKLLFCLAIKRPGMSAMSIASKVISRNRAIGIPDDVNPDGTPNKINQFIYNMAEAVVDEIHNNAVVQMAIPTGGINVQVFGSNAGGPIVATGTNIIDTGGRGIIR